MLELLSCDEAGFSFLNVADVLDPVQAMRVVKGLRHEAAAKAKALNWAGALALFEQALLHLHRSGFASDHPHVAMMEKSIEFCKSKDNR